MGLNISNLVRRIRRSFRNGPWYSDNDAQEDFDLPSTQRPLILHRGEQTSGTTTEWGSVEIISCQRGTECKLYISVYNERDIKVIYATVYQDTATSLSSIVNVLWTNPRTGSSDTMTIVYPVDATVIRDFFL